MKRQIAKIVIGPDVNGAGPFDSLVAYDADGDVVMDDSWGASRAPKDRAAWERAAKRRLRGVLPRGWWDNVTARPAGYDFSHGAEFRKPTAASDE